jgi:hypothetical protein
LAAGAGAGPGDFGTGLLGAPLGAGAFGSPFGSGREVTEVNNKRTGRRSIDCHRDCPAALMQAMKPLVCQSVSISKGEVGRYKSEVSNCRILGVFQTARH